MNGGESVFDDSAFLSKEKNSSLIIPFEVHIERVTVDGQDFLYSLF